MSGLQITAIALCFTIPLLGWALLFRTLWRMAQVFRTGRPDPTRHDEPFQRTKTLLVEFLGHTRMSRLPVVAVAHWLTSLSFLILFFTLVSAFWQLVWADFALPIIGHFVLYEWVTEAFAWGGFFGIIALMALRQRAHPRTAEGEHGRRSRFFGSTFWQAYYVELTILAVTICILSLRSLEYVLAVRTGSPHGSLLHFPLTAWMSFLWNHLSTEWVRESIYVVAAAKILISFAWMIVVSVVPTMGVAWHRFLAFPNIWFKREASGRTALGAARPLMRGGSVVTMADVEAMDEEDDDASGAVPVKLGVENIEDFTWKGLLDFSSCTECGRCQSQCPAWNTEKPLSPKLLMMTLRDHAHAKAPFLLATEDERRALPAHVKNLHEAPLIGEMNYDAEHPTTAYDAWGPSAVIDPDVLWSCTTCGACVEQCPVDIEHVDHILDLRRHQTMMESAFPAEFGGLFKQMESKGNPWGMSPNARMEWAQGLSFPVKVVGEHVTDLTEVEYLFWVGCAGAYEDRAKKTTQAVAELLHMAGVDFAVLGNGETCTGDSARRAGNEILFMMLAEQNVAALTEAKATKVVVTCAHCFNTLRNEYPQFGSQLDVVHHTQLLNRLVRDKQLVPVTRPGGGRALPVGANAGAAATGAVAAAGAGDDALGHGQVTYHDPCYLGRHNQVYAPPRELIETLPGVTLTEMPRHHETSFCCGAGGARMWAEEKLGSRINVNRTNEAVATGADRIAVGCPFCRVMLSDGVTHAQAEGTARAEVEVVDVAQMLLAAVQRPTTVDGSDQPTTVTAEPPTPVQREGDVAAAVDAPATAEGADAPDAAAQQASNEPATSVVIPKVPEDEASPEDNVSPGYLAAAAGSTAAAAASATDADAAPEAPSQDAATAPRSEPSHSGEEAPSAAADTPPPSAADTTSPADAAPPASRTPATPATRTTKEAWKRVQEQAHSTGTLASSDVMELLGVASAPATSAHEAAPATPAEAATSEPAAAAEAPGAEATASSKTPASPPPQQPLAPTPPVDDGTGAAPSSTSTPAAASAGAVDRTAARSALSALAASSAGTPVPSSEVLHALQGVGGGSAPATDPVHNTEPPSDPTSEADATASGPTPSQVPASQQASPAVTYNVGAAREALGALARESSGAPVPSSEVLQRILNAGT